MTFKKPFIFTLLASLFSLAVAYVAEYGFGLKPCHLCLLQRIPYGVVIVLSFVGLWRPYKGLWLLLLIAALFMGEAGLASYHMAVEKSWIAGPSGCTNSNAAVGGSIDDFRSRIEQAPVAACDQPQWEFHGLTMAGFNAIWAFILTLVCFAAMHHLGQKKELYAKTPR